MKRVLFALLLVIGFVARPSSPLDARPVLSGIVAEQTDPAKITVYVTRTGQKYHRDGCRYLSQSKIPMSLKDAARRFDACSVCRPPRVSDR